MKIWKKFAISSVIAAGLSAALMGGSSFVVRQAQGNAEIARSKTVQALTISLNLQLSLREQTLALKDFLLLNRNPLNMAEYQKEKSLFLITLDDLERLMPEAPEIATVRSRHRLFMRLANELTNAPTSQAESAQDLKAINSFSKDIDFYLANLTESARKHDEIAAQEVERWQEFDDIVTQVVIVIIILVLCGKFVIILLPVIRSIEKLQVGAETIGTGNLDYRLDIQTKDEIEQLAREFNLMAAKLAGFYSSLEQKVKERTAELIELNQNLETEITERKQALDSLRQSEEREREKATQLEQALQELRQTQSQLIQTEKMSGLGQLVAGVAHEINNPVNFIYGNITHANEYIENLLRLVQLYQRIYPQPASLIQDCIEEIEFDFLAEDLQKILCSIKIGAERIRQIVLSLRNFSRLDEAEMKPVNLHEGIDNTLLILQNRLKPTRENINIKITKEYGNLPLVECYAGQMNQVFMNILTNAIDALEIGDRKADANILIRTEMLNPNTVRVEIADNGSGITPEVQTRLFDPFFTTKPVGKGTGLGLSISYQIVVQKHQGVLRCESELEKGTHFFIEIPVKQTARESVDSLKIMESRPV